MMDSNTSRNRDRSGFGGSKRKQPLSSADYQRRTEALITERNELKEKLEATESPQRKRRLKRKVETITADLVELHKGLVLSYVKRFKGNSPSTSNHDDFVQAGTVGLLKAINTYEVGRGSTFSSWAWQPIKREVLSAVRDEDHPHLSRSEFEQRKNILEAVKKLKGGDQHRRLTVEEVAEQAGVSVGQTSRVLGSSRPTSLHQPRFAHNDSPVELIDQLEDTAADVDSTVLNTLWLQSISDYGFQCLDSREMYVLSRRLGLDGAEPDNLQSIGRNLGISREATRQIEAKARSKMQHPLVLRRIMPH